MRYTVLWTPRAEQDLAEIWLQAHDRGAVTSAAEAIDALLREDAHTRGESRYGDLRIVFVPPLGVSFEAREDDRTVYVVAVWRIR